MPQFPANLPAGKMILNKVRICLFCHKKITLSSCVPIYVFPPPHPLNAVLLLKTIFVSKALSIQSNYILNCCEREHTLQHVINFCWEVKTAVLIKVLIFAVIFLF